MLTHAHVLARVRLQVISRVKLKWASTNDQVALTERLTNLNRGILGAHAALEVHLP